MKLSVVIPAYNEEQDIEKAIREVAYSFLDPEIIVVNDASTDRTLEILTTLSQEIPTLRVITNPKNMGHGYSVVRGLIEATGTHILYIDADRQIELSNFYKIPEENFEIFDIISGQRVHRNDKLFRKIISFCLRMTILFRYGYYIKDSNCPFKVYQKASLDKLLPKLPETYIVPIACLQVLARKNDMFVSILPTPHKPYEGVRQGFLQVPGLKVWKFCFRAMMEIIRL